MSTRTPSSSSSRLMSTIGLCFLVALMEGWIFRRLALRRVASPVLALDKMQMGWIFSAGILGFTRRVGWDAGRPLWS